LKVVDGQFGIACFQRRQRRKIRFMKLSSVIILAMASLLLAACSSLDNPFSNLFHFGSHDERVYNPQTGEWEWPADKRKPSAAATPASHGNDTRYWDPQHNQWSQGSQERTATASKPSPAPSSDPAPAAATAPAAPAPTPRASHATGVYNASTGKIEWKNPGEAVPSAAPAPEPKKHWYWPF
jgi:hypothetical protein